MLGPRKHVSPVALDELAVAFDGTYRVEDTGRSLRPGTTAFSDNLPRVGRRRARVAVHSDLRDRAEAYASRPPFPLTLRYRAIRHSQLTGCKTVWTHFPLVLPPLRLSG